MRNIQPDNLLSSIVSSTLHLVNAYKLKDPQAKKLLEVIEATNLKNDLDEYPILLDSKPTLTGKRYIFKLCAGVSYHEFVERKVYFETWTGCQVEIYPTDNPILTMTVNKADFPEEIPFDLSTLPEKYLAPIPIGYTTAGELKLIDLTDLPNLLIGGLPGYGKTSFLVGAVLALKSAGVEVCAIDRKRNDFPPLKDWINVAETEEEALSLVNTIQQENERRQLIIQSTPKMRKIQDNPELFKPLVLMVDECLSLESTPTQEMITKLCSTGRAQGICVIIATQKPSASLWDKKFTLARDMCAGRVCFYVSDYMTSQQILGKGNTNGARLPMTKGRASVCMGEREYTVQTMYLSPEGIETGLANLNTHPYFSEITPQEIQKKKRGRPRKNKKEVENV